MSKNNHFYLPISEEVARDCGEAARTYGALVDMLFNNKSRLYSCHQKIADVAGSSVWTVRAHLRVLTQRGWVVNHGRGSGARGRRTNEYEVFPTTDHAPGAPAPPKSVTKKMPHWQLPKTALQADLKWTQVLVLACINTLAKDVDVIHLSSGDVGFGRGYLARKLGITKDQAGGAIAALVRKGFFTYDSSIAQVSLPPRGQGWRGGGVQSNEATVEGAVPDAIGGGVGCNSGVVADPTGGGVRSNRIEPNPNQPNPDDLNPKKPNPTRDGSSDLPQERVLSAEEVSVRFVNEVGLFANIHKWDAHPELQEVTLALVMATWDEHPEIVNFGTSCDGGALVKFHRIITEVLLPDGTQQKNTNRPIGAVHSKIKSFDVRNQKHVWKTLCTYRNDARAILPRLLTLSELHDGVNFSSRKRLADSHIADDDYAIQRVLAKYEKPRSSSFIMRSYVDCPPDGPPNL